MNRTKDQLYELRIESWNQALAETSLTDCPIVHCGDEASCAKYAAENGFQWRNNKSFLCGGYWYNAETQTSLYLIPSSYV
jgi:hypothetical protein